MRRNTAGGVQNLSLLAGLAGAEDAGISSGANGAALPSLANNSDFSTDSVAVTGQAGTTNPFAGVDMEQLRQNAELDQSLSGNGGPGGGPGQGGGPGGGGPGGGGPGAVGRVVEGALAAAEEVLVVEGEAEEAAEEDVEAEVEAAGSEAAGSAISATSSPTNPTAPSSGPAETVP